MPIESTRRSLFVSAVALGGLALRPGRAFGQSYAPGEGERGIHPAYPTQDPALVREVVAAAHTDLERVRELVGARPELAKAGWDWGFGDWETALGAASHMGRRDIAELLIAHGARPNLFTAAMMGQLAVLRAFVAANPGIQKQPGPHGISLLSHARAGGDAARSVAAYLEELGDADPKYTDLPLSDEEKRAYVGIYAFGPAPEERLEILLNRRGGLAIRRGSSFSRALFHQGNHEFHPGGAAAVRIRFTREGEGITALSIFDPGEVLRAERVVEGC